MAQVLAGQRESIGTADDALMGAARLRKAQADQQAVARRRAARTKAAAVRPSVPTTAALDVAGPEFIVTFCRGGEILRTEHADAAGAAQRVVSLAARAGVLYSDIERLDLSESLRMHLSEYVWDDVRASIDAHYTLTVQFVGAL